MTARFDHRDAGTPEAAWDAAVLARTELAFDARRLIVFAAHPDDETLGAGGLIATAAAEGAAVTVVVATDGEAAFPGPGLAVRRRTELAAALDALAPAARVVRLGLADGGLREARAELAARVSAELESADADTLVATTWWGDGHPDHRVLGETVLAHRGTARVLGYPVWYWHWGDPAAPDPGPWRELALTDGARVAKARAIAHHASQLEDRADGPMLHADMLAHFTRPAELFVAAPDANGPTAASGTASADADTGAAETDARDADAGGGATAARFDAYVAAHADPWGLESRWYERRKREVLLACLPRERFRSGLELGCATGVLTERLALRCDDLMGIDAAPTALERARLRVPRVRFALGTLPADWPAGSFDLIVLSEIGYYLTADELRRTRERIRDALAPDGVLVACHWRHPIGDAPLDGDTVHAVLARGRFARAVRHEEDDFVLEVFTAPGIPSVARGEGLL